MKEHTRRRSSRNSKQNMESILPNTGRSRSTSANEKTPQRKRSKSASSNAKTHQRKRKRSISSSTERPKVPKKMVDGRVIDAYCWICHKLGSESICNSCPRVYHKDCLKKLKGSSSKSTLCECQLKTVDGKNEDLFLDARELKKLLQYVMQEAIKEEKKNNQKSQPESNKFCRLFQTWPAENETLCKIMDLNILIDNMNGEEPYLSTGQFFLDVKWIYHNCCILYGFDCEITETALKLEKNFKLELTDMEACPECYHNKYSDNYLHADFFTKVCRKPHPILWAKLRGSPFWPAKCLKIHNGHVDVRFFGTHDKSNILSKKCFRISHEPPYKKIINQTKYQDAIRELSIYVSNYENVIGPFEYYALNTPMEGGKGKRKNHYRRGLQNVNNVQVSRIRKSSESGENLNINKSKGFQEVCDSESRIADPVETKVKASFQFMNSFEDNGSNQSITESVGGVIPNSNVVCHMTFTADEHNGPASELNNTDEFMDSSTSHHSLSQAAFNQNLSFSPLNETADLLSTAAASSEFVETAETEQNTVNFLNPLPVITSAVSANEIPLNSLPVITSTVSNNEISSDIVSVEANTSCSFPVITSAISTCENVDYSSKNIAAPDNQVSANDPHTASSSNLSSFNSGPYASILNEANLSFLLQNTNEHEEEIQVINEERKKTSVQHFLKNPSILKALAEILIGNKPHIKEQFVAFQAYVLRTFLSLWIELSSSRFENSDIKMFIEICNKYVKKIQNLEETNLQAGNEVNELRCQLERMRVITSQKHVLKDTIIRTASQKIQNKDGKKDEAYDKERFRELEEKVEQHKISQNHLIQENESLRTQLEEAKQKMEIKENELSFHRDSVKDFKGILIELNKKARKVRERSIQTEVCPPESPEREIYMPVSAHGINQNQDSSQLLSNNQSNMLLIHRSSMSSVPGNSGLNTSVVEQMYEQNLIMSECSTMMSAPPPGVITAAVAASALMSGPVVVSSNPVNIPQGPIFLDSESSSAFLNSVNPPKPTGPFIKSTKTSGKRKRNNT